MDLEALECCSRPERNSWLLLMSCTTDNRWEGWSNLASAVMMERPAPLPFWRGSSSNLQVQGLPAVAVVTLDLVHFDVLACRAHAGGLLPCHGPALERGLPVGCCGAVMCQPVPDPPRCWEWGQAAGTQPSPGRGVLEVWVQPGEETAQPGSSGCSCVWFALSPLTTPLLWEAERVCWWQADKWISAYVQSAVPGEGNRDLSSPHCFRQCFRLQPGLWLGTFIDCFSGLLLAAQGANNNISNEQAEIWQGGSWQAVIKQLSDLEEGDKQMTVYIDVWRLI